MARQRSETPTRRRGRREGEAQERRSQPGSYRDQWTRDLVDPPAGLRPPAYECWDDVPADLKERAREKEKFVQKFVNEGCPRGKLMEYARKSAEGLGIDEVPPYTTLRDWAHRLRHWGRLGLADSTRDGSSRRLLDDREDEWIAAAVVGGRHSITAAHKVLERLLKPQGVQCPSRWTVARRVEEYKAKDPQIDKLSKAGREGFRERFRLAFPSHGLPPGVRFAIDSTVADIYARVPDVTAESGWRAFRPALTVIMDEGSRLALTYNLSLWAVDSSILLGTLRKACVPGANYPGLPEVSLAPEIRLDAGPEYLGTFRETLKDMGVELLVGDVPEDNGRVERLIQTITTSVFSDLPGYTPIHKATDCYVPTVREADRTLRDLRYEPIRLSIPETALPTLAELDALIHAKLIAYNETPHPRFQTSSPALQRLKLVQKAVLNPDMLMEESHG